MEYKDFLRQKIHFSENSGFDAKYLPDYLFPYQKYLVEWSLKKGRSAIFADTGLGKTAMQLVWAQNVVEKTNKNVLLLAPLAVSYQTVLEGEKFGIEVNRSRDGNPKGKITVTNYQQLDKFNPNEYIGLVLDESSILKNFDGQIKTDITRFINKMPYRSLWTATPSPNDYTELGNSSESLGQLRYLEMIQRFFRDTQNDKNPAWSTPQFVLKKHAIHDFWRWVSSWSRAIKKPSDLGFSDEKYKLPNLFENEHVLECTKPLNGELFVRKAKTLNEQRIERKNTLTKRCEYAAEIVNKHNTSVLWCHTNDESDLLEDIVKGSINIQGSDSDEEKEKKFIAFANGESKKLIIKPKIGAFGLNWQHCNHMTYFPSHSYEQYYQSIRRCYRFGQQSDVTCDIITTEGEIGVYKNIQRKTEEAKKMFEMLVMYMNDSLSLTSKEYIETNINLPKFI
jgi:superfamily II DNA or RNA helicase